jgi:predicted phage-related endonuclease
MIEKIPIHSREEWLQLRLRDITASDVAAVCGEGAYGSAASVYARKLGMVPPAEETAAMKRGRWGEAAVFEALAEECPRWEIRRAKVYLRDPDARLGATPDGVAIVPGRPGLVVVQCKVVALPIFRNEWQHDPSDNVVAAPATAPLGYQLQTLTEAMLADASAGVIAALVVDTFKWTLRLFWVERHAESEAKIREHVATFWREYIGRGVAPPADPQRDFDLMRALYPRDNGSALDLTADNELPQLAAELVAARKDKRSGEAREDAAKTAILSKIGAAASVTFAGGRITAKTLKRKGYTVEPGEYRPIRVIE